MTQVQKDLTHSMPATLAEGRPTRTEQKFRYYDLKKNWRKVKRHLANPALNDILVENFNKYTFGRCNKPFRHGMVPAGFGAMWWPARWQDPKFRWCAYMDYVSHGACRWLVNFNLKLAMLVEPAREWRIITSDEHSTAWDGRDTLFEFNWQAFCEPPETCFHAAYDEELHPGELMEVSFAGHYSERDT